MWILENIARLQEWTTALSHEAYPFAIDPADMIRYSQPRAHQDGSSIGFRLPAERSPELHRMVWDMRIGSPGALVGQRRPQGAFVEPGEYTVRLVSGSVYASMPSGPSVTAPLERRVQVSDDPRVRVSPGDRQMWTDALTRLVATHTDASTALNEIRVYADPERPMRPPLPADLAASVVELSNTLRELIQRLQSLHSAVSSWTGPLTADQGAQTAYYERILADLQARVRTLRDQASRPPR